MDNTNPWRICRPRKSFIKLLYTEQGINGAKSRFPRHRMKELQRHFTIGKLLSYLLLLLLPADAFPGRPVFITSFPFQLCSMEISPPPSLLKDSLFSGRKSKTLQILHSSASHSHLCTSIITFTIYISNSQKWYNTERGKMEQKKNINK